MRGYARALTVLGAIALGGCGASSEPTGMTAAQKADYGEQSKKMMAEQAQKMSAQQGSKSYMGATAPGAQVAPKEKAPGEKAK